MPEFIKNDTVQKQFGSYWSKIVLVKAQTGQRSSKIILAKDPILKSSKIARVYDSKIARILDRFGFVMAKFMIALVWDWSEDLCDQRVIDIRSFQWSRIVSAKDRPYSDVLTLVLDRIGPAFSKSRIVSI